MEKESNNSEKFGQKKPREPFSFYHKLFLIFLTSLLIGSGVLSFLYFQIKEYPLEDQKLSFLVLGASGGVRIGPDLTDTMMLVNIDFERSKLSLISIPRDLWIDPLKIKINAAYHYGGFPLTSSLVKEITGVQPAFSFLLDFQGFKEAIDLVGGIDVEVERTFDDFKYPREDEEGSPVVEGEIYEHVHFEKGKQHMDGEQALKYARSRNSEDPIEGTDAARSLRQQKVLLVFKKKILSPKFLLNPFKISQILKVVNKHLKTDLPRDQIPGLIKLGPKLIRVKKTTSFSLGNGTQNGEILTSPPISKYGQWVLEPRTGDWQEVKDFIAKVLEND